MLYGGGPGGFPAAGRASVTGADVLRLHRLAGADDDAGAPIVAMLEAASELGLAGVRPRLTEQGMLDLSVSTDRSTSQLESGMYLIESAGYHGAEGLNVLKAAAEGAKVGNADLGDTANALTSILNAYHLPASQVVAVTDQLVTTVVSGKMHMQDLASSIASVLPVAASAHISFAQVGGALATMTMHGMSAHRAAMELANMIRSLLNPADTASAEMRALGLNANQVSNDMGKEGLTGTLQTLTDAILKNTSGGSVLLGYMQEMSPQAQGLAREILSGSISTNSLATAVKGAEQVAAEGELVTEARLLRHLCLLREHVVDHDWDRDLDHPELLAFHLHPGRRRRHRQQVDVADRPLERELTAQRPYERGGGREQLHVDLVEGPLPGFQPQAHRERHLAADRVQARDRHRPERAQHDRAVHPVPRRADRLVSIHGLEQVGLQRDGRPDQGHGRHADRESRLPGRPVRPGAGRPAHGGRADRHRGDERRVVQPGWRHRRW